MAAKQHVVPIRQFAQAMLEADSGFAERVQQFEERSGKVDADTLAVLAQAAYLCWGENEHRTDFLQVCRAIGTRKPTSFYHCRQIAPERWVEINTYVVGVQSWAGVDLPLPSGIDGGKVKRIAQWLSGRDKAKDALAELFLCQLIDHLLNISLAKMGRDVMPEEAAHADFTPWYFRPDGARYGTGNREVLVEEYTQRVRQEMMSAPGDAEELIRNILAPDQPPCMHRFSRHLDIQLASIGALKWRGNLPPDDVPKEKWLAFLDESKAALQAWLEDAPASGDLAIKVHEALGKATERGKAMVRDFLLAESRGSPGGWDWLEEKARKEGTKARFIFGC